MSGGEARGDNKEFSLSRGPRAATAMACLVPGSEHRSDPNRVGFRFTPIQRLRCDSSGISTANQPGFSGMYRGQSIALTPFTLDSPGLIPGL